MSFVNYRPQFPGHFNWLGIVLGGHEIVKNVYIENG